MKEIQETHQKKGVVSSDEYYTPLHIIEALGHFDLDPATPPNPMWRTADVMYTKNDDGLRKEWFGRVFLNPPYSRPLVSQFMEKMAAHGNGIALVVPKLGTKMSVKSCTLHAPRYTYSMKESSSTTRIGNSRSHPFVSLCSLPLAKKTKKRSEKVD